MTSSSLDIRQLLEQARQGDSEALGMLLEAYRNYLALLAKLQITPSMRGKLSESDVVQETFLNARRGFSDFRGESEPELIGWLRRILANKMSEMWRRFGAQRRSMDLEQRLGDRLDRSSLHLSRWFAADGPSPSEEAAQREQEVLVADALSLLPNDYREVLVLRHLEGLSFPDVAQRMQRSLDSVKNLWARAIVRLRSALETTM